LISVDESITSMFLDKENGWVTVLSWLLFQ
jgi:hypothetical protein